MIPGSLPRVIWILRELAWYVGSMAQQQRRLGRHVNYFDSFSISGSSYGDDLQSTYSMRIFGNANIGNRNLCNLQVPGQLTFDHDEHVIVQRWYARTELESTALAKRWFENVHATLIVGDRYQWQLSLGDLMARRPRYVTEHEHQQIFDPCPTIIPPRQNMSMLVDAFNGPVLEDLWSDFRSRQSSQNRRTPLVWIHLEGIAVRNGEVLEALGSRFAKVRSIEERIQQWILKMVDGGDDAAIAQAQAFVDGIEEGKHRQ